MFNGRQNNKSKQQSFYNQMTAGIQQGESSSMMNMLSPRNLIKYISTTIEQYNSKPKVYKPEAGEQEQLLKSFEDYWSKIESEHGKYILSKRQNKVNNLKQQKNQQLQFKLKLQRIPKSYFDENYQFFFSQKFNKLALKRKQQEVADHLDEVELLLFNKTSKNPSKYFTCAGNFDSTISLVESNLRKVKHYRQCNQRKLMEISNNQLKVKKIQLRKQNIQCTLNYLHSIKKLKMIKSVQSQHPANLSAQCSNHQFKSKSIESKLQILQNVKKKQLEIGSKIRSLDKIVNNLQFYRQQLKLKVYEQFNKEIIELMNKILAYDKQMWYNTKVNAKMLGKQSQANSINNLLEESKLNITILDQSCFGFQDHCLNSHKAINDEDIPENMFNAKSLQNSQSLKKLLQKLNKIWQSILKFDLYDEVQINQLIMRELIRHNVLFNKDLNEYLNKVFQEFDQKIKKKNQEFNPILQEEVQNEDDQQKSKEISSTDQPSQQIEEEKPQIQTSKKSKYFSTLSELTKIGDLKNLKDLSHLKKKTINTFKRFGNMKKLGQVLGSVKEQAHGQSYCKLKQDQIPQKQQKAKRIQTEQKLSKVDTKFFLKAIKFYYQILSSLTKFIKQNLQLVFFQNFLEKLYSFIQERIRFFFSLRQINQKTSVYDFLLYLNLIEYWIDVCDQVYDSLGKLKQTITDQYLTLLQKNALVNELKKSIDESSYMPCSIGSNNINNLYYVFFWVSIQELKHQEANNMSLTILKDQNKQISSSQILETEKNFKNFVEVKNFQSQFKIIDKKIIYKKQQFIICQSFIALMKELEKYLQLRQVLMQFNSNIEEKICQIIGFYVWYNLKNINKTGPNVKPRSLKNLCNIYSTISFLKLIFSQQLNINNKKFAKTLEQFNQFFKTIDNNISMTPFLLIQQQISLIYQNNTMNGQYQIPCKQTTKILQIIKLSLQELKVHFYRQKIIKTLEPCIKVINKNYFGYLSSIGKRGLLEIKQFLPNYKQILLNYGFKQQNEQIAFNKQIQQHKKVNQNSIKQQNINTKKAQDTHIFLKQIIQMEKNFKSKVSQFK